MKSKINLRQYVKLILYLYNLHKLRKNQWLTLPELENLQAEKLNALLHHAYCNVNYYRKLFDQTGIRPPDIKSIKDLVKIPITSRRELQALPKEEIIATGINPARCLKLRTSGSTGMPLDIFLDSSEITLRWLFYRRMYFANGAKLRDKEIKITTPQHFATGQWFQKIGILKIKYLSIFDSIEDQLKVILAFKPDIIESYASTLKNLAMEFKEKRIKNIRPRIIFSTAELLNRRDREFLESVFRAEIFDYYACNEFGIIAWECKEHNGYHIDSDNAIVEFLKEDGTKAKPGEEGEIVITSLNSYTMPFIRYRMGDIGVLSDKKCPCGRTLPLMKIMIGRTNDFVVLPSGLKISAYKLMVTMDSIKGIHKYKITQEEGRKIRINIVFQETLLKSEITYKTMKLIETYKGILGTDMAIEVIPEKEIVNEKIGKHRYVVSRL